MHRKRGTGSAAPRPAPFRRRKHRGWTHSSCCLHDGRENDIVSTAAWPRCLPGACAGGRTHVHFQQGNFISSGPLHLAGQVPQQRSLPRAAIASSRLPERAERASVKRGWKWRTPGPLTPRGHPATESAASSDSTFGRSATGEGFCFPLRPCVQASGGLDGLTPPRTNCAAASPATPTQRLREPPRGTP